MVSFLYYSIGIDASINPGLELPNSVGAGLEHIVFPKPNVFGDIGTLAAVSTVTKALKSLQVSTDIKFTGYNGIMCPVMEDLILTQRSNELKYKLKDLLLFSSVCGVGTDEAIVFDISL